MKRQTDSNFFQKLMNKGKIGWWEANLNTESYVCSEYISDLLGLGEEGTISFEDFNKRILKEDQLHATPFFSNTIQQTTEEVYLINTLNGNIWLRSKVCYQEIDEEGNTKVYGIAETQDGAHLASAYQALQNSERILHNIYKNLPVGIELYDKEGHLIDLNIKDMEMFHINHKEDVLGINIFDNPVFSEEIKEMIRTHKDADFSFQYKYSMISEYYKSQMSNGSIDLMTRITTLYDNSQMPINYLLINMDKTENTIAYNKIQEFENFFDLVGDYAKVGYAYFDALSRDGYALRSWYRNVGEIEGTPLPEIIGVHGHFPPEDRAVILAFLDQVVNGNATKLSRDVRILREDGHYTWTRINVMVRSYRPQDNVIEMLCINYDITKLKETEQMLIQSKEKAEESDRLKSAFLANMSHEIRPPLNAIVGFSSLLQETTDSFEKQQYISIIEENNKLLLQLISDILDLSKIEAGTIEMTREKVNARQICIELEEMMKMKAKPGVNLLLATCLPDLYFTSDKNRLQQVLLNFITNALKFTDKGSIIIDYKLQDHFVKFSVTDTGIGIQQDKQATVFNRFVKLNSFIPGTGLGLSICQSIITQLGGEIGVESEFGKGSCFWFTHPLENNY